MGNSTVRRAISAIGVCAIVAAGAIACDDGRRHHDDGVLFIPYIIPAIGYPGAPGYVPARTIPPGGPGYPRVNPPTAPKANPPATAPRMNPARPVRIPAIRAR